MELVYMYIEKFNNIIADEQINFSSKFNIKIQDSKLILEKIESEMISMYGDNIKNITMFLGKNGTGKTSVLDILGMQRGDRCKCSIKGNYKEDIIDSYLMMYHIKENYYVLEVIDDRILSKIINIHNDNLRELFYKLPMAVILEENNGDFYIKDNLFNDTININNIKFNYINDKSNRIDYRQYSYLDDDGYLYQRKYNIYSSKELQYLYLYKLNNIKNLDFDKNIARLRVKCNIGYDRHLLQDNKIESMIKYLEDNLYIYRKHQVRLKFKGVSNMINNHQQYSNREKYILDALSKYIIDEFINGLYESINYHHIDGKDYIFDDNYYKLSNILEKIKSSKYISSIALLGKAEDISIEFERLQYVIKYYKQQDVGEYLEKIYISRYLYSRIDTINNLRDTKYQDAIEEFIENIKLLEEKYFKGDEIEIDCKSNQDKEVIKLLKCYDEYYNNQSKDGYINDLSSRFGIKVTNLSEGEEQFLMLNVKIFDILKNKNKDETTILLLDEPDKSLHPEWSRRFIDNIVNEINNKYDTNVQLIITTHSPFMVSDMTSRNVYCFESEELDNYKKINISSMNDKTKKIHNTFGANIYEILSDSFILNRTLGEFAYNKILEMINILQNGNNEYNNYFIEEFIEIVGEKVIRDKLRNINNKRKLDSIKNKKNQLIMLLENNDLDDEKIEKINKILED